MALSIFANIAKGDSKITKQIGLRNICTNRSEWQYLLFYDIDNYTEEKQRVLQYQLDMDAISYIIYSTKHGLHAVGLTPMRVTDWANCFHILQGAIPEYYNGQTIRLSRKIGEEQKLLHTNFNYPIIGNLLEIYTKRFYRDAPCIDTIITETHWRLVFEKYYTPKS